MAKSFMRIGLAACAAAVSGLCLAMVTTTTVTGVVDTRLVRSSDDVALAVVDSRRPIMQVTDVGSFDSGPLGCAIIIR